MKDRDVKSSDRPRPQDTMASASSRPATWSRLSQCRTVGLLILCSVANNILSIQLNIGNCYCTRQTSSKAPANIALLSLQIVTIIRVCRLSNFWQSWGLRSRSYDKTGLRPASVLVLVLVLYFWSCLKHCCARQVLCDRIMLKCNKHLYFFVQ